MARADRENVLDNCPLTKLQVHRHSDETINRTSYRGPNIAFLLPRFVVIRARS